ncbi:hypothetical protein [Streptomyces sp. NPDC059008]|uniref:hypothetical protein n=1 Tax=Streptomyces sp. NPDC059008 TaxID=3346693 RepID=UPI0036BA694C
MRRLAAVIRGIAPFPGVSTNPAQVLGAKLGADVDGEANAAFTVDDTSCPDIAP